MVTFLVCLTRFHAGRTTITIAHRLSTIKDADIIYVMGNGLVLESGTHNELLSNDGAYARLVQSQKLRESQDVVDADGSDEGSDAGEEKDMEKLAREEVPLGRSNTQRSLASEIIEKRNAEAEGKSDKDHSLPYLFKRMGVIVKDQWPKYLFGSIAATREYSARFSEQSFLILFFS